MHRHSRTHTLTHKHKYTHVRIQKLDRQKPNYLHTVSRLLNLTHAPAYPPTNPPNKDSTELLQRLWCWKYLGEGVLIQDIIIVELLKRYLKDKHRAPAYSLALFRVSCFVFHDSSSGETTWRLKSGCGKNKRKETDTPIRLIPSVNREIERRRSGWVRVGILDDFRP